MKLTASAITRRAFGCALGGAVLSLSRSASASDRLTWDEPTTSAQTVECRYRADAQILLLSVPLLHRTGVGGGSAVWREATEPGGQLVRFLEFNGFSIPSRAAGLNRLGFIREMSRMAGGNNLESLYFGLMTASPEESAEQARSALRNTAKEQLYTTIDGRVTPAVVETTTAHFAAPSSLSASNRTELMESARQALATAPKISAGPATTGSNVPFLQALAAMLRRSDQKSSEFVYAGRAYSLSATRSPDAKATAYFRERHLIPAGGSVIQVAGKLRRQAGGKETEFRLWIEQAAERPLPLRIEYRAKSYLRLIFEVEAA